MPDYPHLGGIGFPDENEHNSNSYISGLLEAVGGLPVQPNIQARKIHVRGGDTDVYQSAPLYDKPVPEKYYKPLSGE